MGNFSSHEPPVLALDGWLLALRDLALSVWLSGSGPSYGTPVKKIATLLWRSC